MAEQATWSEEFQEANGQSSIHLDAVPRRDHMGNFLDAVRNGDRLACDVDLGCSVMVAIKMGVEAYRQNKVLLWDTDAEEVVAT